MKVELFGGPMDGLIQEDFPIGASCLFFIAPVSLAPIGALGQMPPKDRTVKRYVYWLDRIDTTGQFGRMEYRGLG